MSNIGILGTNSETKNKIMCSIRKGPMLFCMGWKNGKAWHCGKSKVQPNYEKEAVGTSQSGPRAAVQWATSLAHSCRRFDTGHLI